MNDIRNLNIWKQEQVKKSGQESFREIDITELNLSVRSFNCLKRAGCHTIGDILPYFTEEGQGLRRIRNLGSRSESEIIERIKEMEELYAKEAPLSESQPPRRLIKAGRNVWNLKISQMHLSQNSLQNLQSCGIQRIGDIYHTEIDKEPGWYAVRELFEKIMAM